MKSEKVTEARSRWYDDACGTAHALELVGERWSLLVVRELLMGPRRFGELRASLPGISANVLTQRLTGLEAAGIVRRERLPPPASAQVYALTPWGMESEPVVLALGRWALRSPAHDTSLPFSRVSLMLSLRMLMVQERAAGFTATVAFHLGEERYVARLTAGDLRVWRGEVEVPDAILAGETAAFKPVLYGGMPLAVAEATGRIAVAGNRAVVERFTGLFRLPDKVE